MQKTSNSEGQVEGNGNIIWAWPPLWTPVERRNQLYKEVI
jgi:hypothetical protein